MLAGKRMLFAAEFQQGSTGQGLAHGFRELDWAVHEVEFRQFFPRLPGRAERILIKPLQPQFRSSYNESILAAARMVEPQVFITVKGSLIRHETLNDLRRRNIKTVMYYPDFHFEFGDIDPVLLDAFDLFVTSKSFQLDYLTKRLGDDRVAFVHHGYCDLVHRPLREPIQPMFDVLYVGNYAPEKEQWLSAIARRLPDVRLSIIGSRWQVAKDRDLTRSALGYGLVGDNCARAIQSARINIAVHGGVKQPEGWRDLVSTRTFEIPACKGFMLHVDSPEIRSLFDIGGEIDVFAGEDEFIEKIVFYLARPEVRASMVERAYLRAVPQYGYLARAAAISQFLSERLGIPAGAASSAHDAVDRLKLASF